jgi:hypothetical protein
MLISEEAYTAAAAAGAAGLVDCSPSPPDAELRLKERERREAGKVGELGMDCSRFPNLSLLRRPAQPSPALETMPAQ